MPASSAGKATFPKKNAHAPYRSDRNEGWLKVKCVQKGKFPVIGFVKDPTGVAALYLGKKEGKELRYMGKQRLGIDLRIHPDPSPVAKVDLDQSIPGGR